MSAAVTAFPAKAGAIQTTVAELPPLIAATNKVFSDSHRRMIALSLLGFCALRHCWCWVSAEYMRYWLKVALGEGQMAAAENAGRQMIKDGYLLLELRENKWKVFPTAKLIDAVMAQGT